jgi:hypothetical protein
VRKAARKAAAQTGPNPAQTGPNPPRPPKRDESKYHKGSCDMRWIADPVGDGAPPGAWDAVKPGDFWFGEEVATVGGTEFRYRVMWAKYPDGCLACLPLDMPVEVKNAGVRGASWHFFNGNLEKPTLSPSIHHVGHWHGYVRAGRMESV